MKSEIKKVIKKLTKKFQKSKKIKIRKTKNFIEKSRNKNMIKN